MIEEEKYNLVIIGGGPAALTFLYQLLKKSKLPEYLNGLGLCIIEKSKYFGSGNYETKLNYSNSSAIETLRYLIFDNQRQEQKQQQSDVDFWEQPLKKTNQEDSEKRDSQFQDEPSQFLKNLDKNCMALCRELTELHAYQQMVAYGQKQPPKSLLGYFLRLLGNVMLRHIKSVKKKLVFKHSSEAIALRLQTDGWVQIRIHRNNSNINNAFQTIKAKSVLLCTGSEQVPVPQNISPPITDEDQLIKVYQQIGRKPTQKVVILGGGQCAFECADLLLEGPVTYRQEEEWNTNFAKKRQNCENCCVCKKNAKRCQCDCLCYGSLKLMQYKWNTTYQEDVLIPEFKSHGIVIVAEEKPEVYWERSEGKVDPECVGPQGHVNILNGLRGRAKELYLRVARKEEKRVKVMSPPKDMELFKEACVVIESRNTRGKAVGLKDMDGNAIKLMTFQERLLVDQFGRVRHEKGSVKKVYAYGSCSYSSDLVEMSSRRERSRKVGESSLSYQECCKVEYITRGMKLIEESMKNREEGLIQSWFDQNEFPRTGQSSQFLIIASTLKSSNKKPSLSTPSTKCSNKTSMYNLLEILYIIQYIYIIYLQYIIFKIERTRLDSIKLIRFTTISECLFHMNIYLPTLRVLSILAMQSRMVSLSSSSRMQGISRKALSSQNFLSLPSTMRSTILSSFLSMPSLSSAFCLSSSSAGMSPRAMYSGFMPSMEMATLVLPSCKAALPSSRSPTSSTTHALVPSTDPSQVLCVYTPRMLVGVSFHSWRRLTVMFSCSLEMSSFLSCSSSGHCASPSCSLSRVFWMTRSEKRRKSLVLATKSVSQLICANTALPPCLTAPITPSPVWFPSFFSALSSPFSLRNSTASCRSPDVDSRASLQSLIGDPVSSFSCFMSATEKQYGLMVLSIHDQNINLHPMSFHYSSQPELIRQSQKDHEAVYALYQRLVSLLEHLHPRFLNYRTLHRHQVLLHSLTAFLYYYLTTFHRKRTLGEEYTSLHQFNQQDYDYHGLPVKKQRALAFILLISSSPYLLEQAKKKYQRKVQGMENKVLQSILPEFDTMAEKVQLLHMAIFFIHSNYFEISRRVSGIKQIFTRAPPTHNLNYKNLGRLLLVGLAVQLVGYSVSVWRAVRRLRESGEQLRLEEEEGEGEKSLTCQLCLDSVRNVSSTPCGHLFCWDCITQYANTKPQCPSCRSHTPANKIVQLINYS